MKKLPIAASVTWLLVFICIAVSLIVVKTRAWVAGHASPTVASTPAPSPPSDEDESVPDRLKAIAEVYDPRKFSYLNDERAQMAGQMLDQPMSIGQRYEVEGLYAQELLNSGKSEDALNEYQLMEKQYRQYLPSKYPKMRTFFLMQEATAYMRIGEQQNCCASNNSDSCLVPITGRGIHTLRYGSQNAVDCLTQILKLEPDNVKARWLLNIAYMTLGDYPKRVPAQWLIPAKAYGGDCSMPKFYNGAHDLGLDALNCAGGAAMEDFEGNGNLDLMISSMRPDGQLRYFRNNGDGTFTERTREAGLIGETGGLNLITTDYNNDGRPDVLILRGGWFAKNGHLPMSLLRNDGNGHFTDVTIPSGLITHDSPTQTAVWFDYNGDGWLDLFVGNESTPGDPCPCELFRNNRDGTFTDVAPECGLNITKYVKGVVSADYDHSGRPSLYLSCQGSRNILMRNDGPAGSDKSPTGAWKFTDVSHFAGVDKQMYSFSCFFFDYDNDGWPDLYVDGYHIGDVAEIAKDYLGMPTTTERARLYHNNHDGTFTDVTKQAHLYKVIQGMGVNFGDLDNDGWLDFYAGTGNPDLTTLVPKRMFRNHDGKYFDEVTTTGDFGHLQKGHGIAFGDINNNGQEDVFEEMGGAWSGDTAHNCLYINPGNHNHWVTLKLVGVQSNRVAIGAEICVTTATPHGDRNIYNTVGSGGSFGCNPFRQHIGLGDATQIRQVTIHWPASGITQVVKNLAMDRFYIITEGNPLAQPWDVKSFKLPIHPKEQVASAGIIVN